MHDRLNGAHLRLVGLVVWSPLPPTPPERGAGGGRPTPLGWGGGLLNFVKIQFASTEHFVPLQRLTRNQRAINPRPSRGHIQTKKQVIKWQK